MPFTLRRDTTNVPVAGYDDVNDLLKAKIFYGTTEVSTTNPLPVRLDVVLSATAFWNAAAATANSTSTAVNVSTSKIRVLVSTDAATTITVQHSANGTAWYDGEQIVFSAAGTKTAVVEAVGHVRLHTSAAATLTAGYIAIA